MEQELQHKLAQLQQQTHEVGVPQDIQASVCGDTSCQGLSQSAKRAAPHIYSCNVMSWCVSRQIVDTQGASSALPLICVVC
jgi:hypothetical protein